MARQREDPGLDDPVGMEIAGIRLKSVVFPGEAGDHQRGGRKDLLERVLGDEYERYHAFLGEELAALGGPPSPRKYGDDIKAYAAACGRHSELQRAEIALRRCHEKRRGRRGERVPLLDSDHRLVSIADWVPPSTSIEVPSTSSPRGPDMWPE